MTAAPVNLCLLWVLADRKQQIYFFSLPSPCCLFDHDDMIIASKQSWAATLSGEIGVVVLVVATHQKSRQTGRETALITEIYSTVDPDGIAGAH